MRYKTKLNLKNLWQVGHVRNCKLIQLHSSFTMHHITDHIHIVFTGYRLSVKQNKKQLFDVANSSRWADAVFEIWQQGKLILLSLQLILDQFSFYFLTYTIRNTNTLITPKPIFIQLLLIYYLGSLITFPSLLFKVITKVEDGFKCYYVLIIIR